MISLAMEVRELPRTDESVHELGDVLQDDVLGGQPRAHDVAEHILPVVLVTHLPVDARVLRLLAPRFLVLLEVG